MELGHIAERAEAAQAVARVAGAAALEFYRDRASLGVEAKGPQDRVTLADRAVETLIRSSLGEQFPGDAFFGEEDGPSPNALDTDGGVWVVDPIDGTDCFVFGIPSWSISIAWLNRRRVTIGVVYDPLHEEMFAAALGGGATLNGRAIQASDITEATAGLVGIGYSSRVAPDDTLAALRRLMDAGGMFHRCGSGALSLAWVAAGRLAGYFEPHMHAWDCLAGLLLVREAGGWTNDFLAGNGLADGNPAVAAAPGLIEHLRFVGGMGPIESGVAGGVEAAP